MTKCGAVVDSANYYALAENKRVAVDCFEDEVIKDSIIQSQAATLNTQERENKLLKEDNLAWRMQNDNLSNSLTLEKPKKFKWGAFGLGLGFLAALFVL